ncbi:MAG: CRISPR-associated helicase Cas3' [Succinimonas sp.]|nr:CRISPR-associated helicase Cas3' [Succinimonas sp.]
MKTDDKLVMSLWAKKKESDGQLYWLSLKQHLLDTMNVSRWLWKYWLSESQRRLCINSLCSTDSDSNIALNLAAFLGAIHDIGKATPAFQIKKGFRRSNRLDEMILSNLEQSGFSELGSLCLADPDMSRHSIAGEYLLKNRFNVREDIVSIIGAHHGKPDDDVCSVNDQSAYSANYYQNEKNTTIQNRWKNVQSSIFNWAMNITSFEDVQQLPKISKPVQVIYSGLLIMADWIASNCDYFPLVPLESGSSFDINNDERFEKGIQLWCKNLPFQIHNNPDVENLFRWRFGFEPRDFQRVVYRTTSEIKDPGILIIEAPMGLGKTEAMLVASEILALKSGSSGLFFGLPTQATSNGMFGRIHAWLKDLTGRYGVTQSLRLCHGKAALNEEMSKLLRESSIQDINIDDTENGCVFVNEWFAGRKKTALDDFVVGTVDGFLRCALKQKHLALRHLGFSKKVVIIDEVHAYDTYMQQYLVEAIKWMGAYGVPVILASATLPKDKRKSLILAYLRGKGFKSRDIVFNENISGNSYPLITYTEGKEVKEETNFNNTGDKTVVLKKLNEEELLCRVEELLEGGGVIGIIVNTVKKAQILGRDLKNHFGNDTVVILHSAFIATDRIVKESNLLDMIGKNGNRPERKIIIGTQVIEQSLDIDFDVLITDLCPVDLLLQRLGRLHRHERKRPDKHKNPVVYVMGTSDSFDFEKGSEVIYGKFYLIRTQCYLPDIICIPSDIPNLVNKVYGMDHPDFSDELNAIYQESIIMNNNDVKNKIDKAMTYCIDDPVSFINPARNNLIGWLKNLNNSDSEEMANAQVRDIRESVEVIALKTVGGGYGTFKNRVDVSKLICDESIAKDLAKDTIRIPYYVTCNRGVSATIKELEEYNRQKLNDWHKYSWLKGSLGIIFDENGCFEINGIKLKYDDEFGLREEISDGEV